jgi:hypothetical protein
MSISDSFIRVPEYKCHTTVGALKIKAVELDKDRATRESDGSAVLVPEDSQYAPFKVPREYVQKHQPMAGGYYVIHEDGYKSFSPGPAFEKEYTLEEVKTQRSKVVRALKDLSFAMQVDPELAWSWHCNTAMVAKDAGAPHEEANKRAADFMHRLFEVDTTKQPIQPEPFATKETPCEHTRPWPERTVAIMNNSDTVIVVDDHCYAVQNWNGSEWRRSAWIFREALAALKTLPDNPDDAVTVAENSV